MHTTRPTLSLTNATHFLDLPVNHSPSHYLVAKLHPLPHGRFAPRSRTSTRAKKVISTSASLPARRRKRNTIVHVFISLLRARGVHVTRLHEPKGLCIFSSNARHNVSTRNSTHCHPLRWHSRRELKSLHETMNKVDAERNAQRVPVQHWMQRTHFVCVSVCRPSCGQRPSYPKLKLSTYPNHNRRHTWQG